MQISTIAVNADQIAPVQYPDSMLRAGKSGKVTLRVSYSKTGEVLAADVVPELSEGGISFERAAKRHALKWKFFVEEVGGVAHAGVALIPFVFTIEPGQSGPYTFKLPGGKELFMMPGEPKPNIIAIDAQATLIEPFKPKSLVDG